jgi:hypothetical protein
MISLALERINVVEKEILSGAVSGGLVPQEASDEPADSLLVRSGMPPADKIEIGEEAVERRDVTKRQVAGSSTDEPRLAATLKSSGPMTIPELCRAAGFDLNEIGEIERFYLALREEIDTSVEATGGPAENQMLRAVADAP